MTCLSPLGYIGSYNVKCNKLDRSDVITIFPYIKVEEYNAKLYDIQDYEIRSTFKFSTLRDKLELSFTMRYGGYSTSIKADVR